jgi:hypothetical protein
VGLDYAFDALSVPICMDRVESLNTGFQGALDDFLIDYFTTKPESGGDSVLLTQPTWNCCCYSLSCVAGAAARQLRKGT